MSSLHSLIYLLSSGYFTIPCFLKSAGRWTQHFFHLGSQFNFITSRTSLGSQWLFCRLSLTFTFIFTFLELGAGARCCACCPLRAFIHSWPLLAGSSSSEDESRRKRKWHTNLKTWKLFSAAIINGRLQAELLFSATFGCHTFITTKPGENRHEFDYGHDALSPAWVFRETALFSVCLQCQSYLGPSLPLTTALITRTE